MQYAETTLAVACARTATMVELVNIRTIMKASELVKKFVSREQIDEQIKRANDDGYCATYVPCEVALNQGVIDSLIQDGFRICIVRSRENFGQVYKIEW